ncbi:glucan biosynthesis protein [Novosphingobium mangrovi (ex Huang et al. 2023)]|uniref:Glucan biosynthesis protein n=1 Tax=Novosphingobium mangrovi (ex Huang et al. 2023) TaxID=2976432 RepID=A0ABT2I9L2_9SPHN|nr:glucan biosynthesis protein [Novosphingobium mangrovi (ex Huang et al. 2023)]MCT2401512.1 glucan biosynthesis protein [Novosphingobium mangrovi (ex Huang et al. 2023)]
MDLALLSRRDACIFLAGLVSLAGTGAAARPTGRFGPSVRFSRDTLVAQARRRAARGYVPPSAWPEVTRDYDAYGRLAYGAADRLAGLVRLMPVSHMASAPVGIHVVENGAARTVRSFEGLFAGGNSAPAGFRIMAPDLASDWLSYLGASYFRADGAQHQYGLSARGIAVDTGFARAEEFPRFTDFWIEWRTDAHFVIHALLDGPSLTGAFTFDCHDGADGVVQAVQATLFLRKDIERLGIAPATSMFWYGEGQRALATDWRPEVHDSDGLAVWSGTGERIWRSLRNPRQARTNSFRADSLKGFGLMQRDRRFADYQDDGVWYDRRPSLWVEPEGDWGPGAVMLYEMPTDSETVDNIVAFWLSDRPARAGERRDLSYRLHWTSGDPVDDGSARVVDIWTGASGDPGGPSRPGARKFVIDFRGPGLAGLDRESGVEPVVSLSGPALVGLAAYPVLGQEALWRVVVDVRTDLDQPRDFRLYLRRGSSALSETLIQPLQS